MGSDGGPPLPGEKSVSGRKEEIVDGVVENAPAGAEAPAALGAPAAPAARAKKAGVESFDVKWSENAGTTATNARLRLDYFAKFKKDEEHDPALAEFRQNVKTKWEITDGPNKGQSGDTGPMHDDNYSRADDVAGHTLSDEDFVSNDNPGLPSIHPNDELDYSFTAEQMIIDTSRGNKVLEKRGPATGTIKGKHPRKFGLPSRC